MIDAGLAVVIGPWATMWVMLAWYQNKLLRDEREFREQYRRESQEKIERMEAKLEELTRLVTGCQSQPCGVRDQIVQRGSIWANMQSRVSARKSRRTSGTSQSEQ